ncbi:MAG TPA: lectin-like protein [Verrucomicrobiae bacterium]|nr:lectin-like protein [Verrucomicrobiae bacterium]
MKASNTTRLSAVLVVLMAICAATKLMATPISGPMVDPATGHTYYLLANSDWTDAQSQALTLGGNLTTVNDAAENAWISQTFTNFGGVQRNLWIGLNAAGLDGTNPSDYSWIDGSSSNYRNWAPLQPGFTGNPANQYAYIIPGGNANSGQWNNVPNQTTAGYQFNPAIPLYGVAEVVPEPSTYLLALLGSVVIWGKLATSRNWVNRSRHFNR